jgi:formylglycine-generating enzyme required for sulfatase activity
VGESVASTQTPGPSEVAASEEPVEETTTALTTIPVGFAPVTRNGDWTPVIQEFDGVAMALVPVGCFMMGSNDGQSDEQPVHQVCFEEPFWIDHYEVTNSQFGEFGGRAESITNWVGAAVPRDSVSWEEAQTFCEQRGGSLPTEAMWEYAARGPDSLTFPWGNTFVSDNAIWTGQGASPAGSKPAGASWVGAEDLSGSVVEWIYDYYGNYSASTQINPHGPTEGIYRVLRGGSWFDGSEKLRGSYRYPYLPNNSSFQFGFRCARDYEDQDGTASPEATIDPRAFPVPEGGCPPGSFYYPPTGLCHPANP